LFLILDEIRQVDLNNTTLERVIGISYTPAVRRAKTKGLLILTKTL
jgi:hypothetical protein